MIDLTNICKEIAEKIMHCEGIFASAERISSTHYPSAVISAEVKSGTPCDGGRQLWRQVLVSISLYCERERSSEGQSNLASRVLSCIVPYFTACGRRFVPEDITTDGDKIAFTLSFYDLPPCDTASAPSDYMSEIIFDI